MNLTAQQIATLIEAIKFAVERAGEPAKRDRFQEILEDIEDLLN